MHKVKRIIWQRRQLIKCSRGCAEPAEENFNLDKVAIFMCITDTYRPQHSVEQIQLGHNGLFCAFSIVCVYLLMDKVMAFW